MVKLEELELSRLVSFRNEIEQDIRERKQNISGNKFQKNLLYYQLETRVLLLARLERHIKNFSHETTT